MTDSTLKERFGRQVPIRAIPRVSSGSPAVFVLQLPADRIVLRPIDAMLALVRRGLNMLEAKRAVEEAVEHGRAFVRLPMVEDAAVLAQDLAQAGLPAAQVRAGAVNLPKLREALGLTQEQFALRYGIEAELLRHWEAGQLEPDATARSYLQAIANNPRLVEEAYAPVPLNAS